jgi:hypothetical protein
MERRCAAAYSQPLPDNSGETRDAFVYAPLYACAFKRLFRNRRLRRGLDAEWWRHRSRATECLCGLVALPELPSSWRSQKLSNSRENLLDADRAHAKFVKHGVLTKSAYNFRGPKALFFWRGKFYLALRSGWRRLQIKIQWPDTSFRQAGRNCEYFYGPPGSHDHILAFGGPGSMPPPFNAHATTYPAVTTQDVSSSGMYICIYNCIAPTSQKIARFKGATRTVKNGKRRGFPNCQSSFASKSHDRPHCVPVPRVLRYPAKRFSVLMDL